MEAAAASRVGRKQGRRRTAAVQPQAMRTSGRSAVVGGADARALLERRGAVLGAALAALAAVRAGTDGRRAALGDALLDDAADDSTEAGGAAIGDSGLVLDALLRSSGG